MTNLEALRANKAALAELFRRAIRAKVEQWDAESAIENVVGEIDGMDTAVEDFAVGIDSVEEVDFDDDELIEALAPLLQEPDAEAEPQPE